MFFFYFSKNALFFFFLSFFLSFALFLLCFVLLFWCSFRSDVNGFSLFFAFVSCQHILHWGVCLQDQDKCATCTSSGCSCTTGTLWKFEACQQKMCVRCFQFPNGKFETQVAPLISASSCPSATQDQAVVCSSAQFKPIYSYADRCIDFGNGAGSLNCVQAYRDSMNTVAPEASTQFYICAFVFIFLNKSNSARADN